MTQPIIQTQNLNFGFQKNKTLIHDLNLCVEKGAIYGFLGPNGAGKTTTIRLLLGLLKSEKNNIRLFDKELDTNRLEIFSKIGTLIEMPSLYDHLTGFDNLEITRRLKNVPVSRISKVLELVRLDKDAHRKTKEYSLGMKQRLGLAIALLSDPELLILDEPTNGLDPNGIMEMRELLVNLNQQHGTTIFLSSHLLAEIEKMVTHIGIITQGNLVFEGSISELQDKKSSQAQLLIQTSDNTKAKHLLENYGIYLKENDFLGLPFESKQQASDINKLLISNDIDVYQLTIAHNDLEKIFMKLTESSTNL